MYTVGYSKCALVSGHNGECGHSPKLCVACFHVDYWQSLFSQSSKLKGRSELLEPYVTF